jgi:hypothetical protein
MTKDVLFAVAIRLHQGERPQGLRAQLWLLARPSTGVMPSLASADGTRPHPGRRRTAFRRATVLRAVSRGRKVSHGAPLAHEHHVLVPDAAELH